MNQIHAHWPHQEVVLLGGSADRVLLEEIASKSDKRPAVCAGGLSLLGSAALMSHARVVVSNDSAPLHMAGAVQCPAVGVFLQHHPRLGVWCVASIFGPMALEPMWNWLPLPKEAWDCKPCGLHGFKQCPEGHFRCGLDLPCQRSDGCSGARQQPSILRPWAFKIWSTQVPVTNSTYSWVDVPSMVIRISTPLS